MNRREQTIQRSIAWPESMYRAIEKQAKKRGIPVSAYIRFATEQQLNEDGEDVRDNLMWGGFRYSENEDEATGQRAGEATAIA